MRKTVRDHAAQPLAISYPPARHRPNTEHHVIDKQLMLERYLPDCGHPRVGLRVGNDMRVQLVDDLLHCFTARACQRLAPRLFDVGDCITAPLGPRCHLSRQRADGPRCVRPPRLVRKIRNRRHSWDRRDDSPERHSRPRNCHPEYERRLAGWPDAWTRQRPSTAAISPPRFDAFTNRPRGEQERDGRVDPGPPLRGGYHKADQHRAGLRGADQVLDAFANRSPRRGPRRALVAFLVSTRCRISEVLQLDRADWNRERSRRGRAVSGGTGRRRPSALPELQPRTPARRLTVRGAEDVCTRLGVAHRVTKLHPHRLRHTAGTIVQEELGDPRLTAEFSGTTASARWPATPR
jgi:hypothetical protein